MSIEMMKERLAKAMEYQNIGLKNIQKEALLEELKGRHIWVEKEREFSIAFEDVNWFLKYCSGSGYSIGTSSINKFYLPAVNKLEITKKTEGILSFVDYELIITDTEAEEEIRIIVQK